MRRVRQCTNFWTQTFQFNNGLPVAARTLFPTSQAALRGHRRQQPTTRSTPRALVRRSCASTIRNRTPTSSKAASTASSRFENGSTFGFGVETRAMEAHQLHSDSNLTMGDWGVGDAGQRAGHGRAADPVQPHGRVRRLHSGRCSDRRLEGQCERARLWAINSGVSSTGRRYTNWTEASAPDGELRYNPGFNTDSTVEEDTQAVYAQFAMKFDLGAMPSNLVVGARYEETDVHSVEQPARSDGAAVAGRQRLPGRASHVSRRWSTVTAATTTCCRTWTSTSACPIR